MAARCFQNGSQTAYGALHQQDIATQVKAIGQQVDSCDLAAKSIAELEPEKFVLSVLVVCWHTGEHFAVKVGNLAKIIAAVGQRLPQDQRIANAPLRINRGT